MNSNEYEEINEYLDWYENLLTPKQREVMSLYYREDFSLAEIAENMDITRSAVSDLIRRVIKTLEEYERKLNLVHKFHQRTACYKELEKINSMEVKAIVQKLYENE